MRAKIYLLLIFAGLALTPGRVLAQQTTYPCPTGGVNIVCIDSITVVPATSSTGVSIDVHWVLLTANLPSDFGNRGPFNQQYFQLQYIFPGGQPKQLSQLAPIYAVSGTYGLYDIAFPNSSAATPTQLPAGNYIFKVQACWAQALAPSKCYGDNINQDGSWFTVNWTAPSAAPTSSKNSNPSSSATCTGGATSVVSPCTCMINDQPSACDPAETAACLSAAQLAKVPKCPGSQYLVCGNLPAIGARDTAGNWFNKVSLKCQKIPASVSPGGKTGAPPNGSGLPVSNPQNNKNTKKQ
jgi:hypothetical protein